ncbi:MAG: hypothetical protein KF841_07705 [Phycisphaerae bacterium]|nr:hypothetical protein [Phycisphaerae bacterium]
MSRGNTLIIPPYPGEFGWELMNWQGRVRRVIRESDSARVYVVAPPDRRALYSDLIDGRVVRFCPMPRHEWTGDANDDHRIDGSGSAIPPSTLESELRQATAGHLAILGVHTEGATWYMPGFRSELCPATCAEQDFVSLRKQPDTRTDVVLVPRGRALASERNQPETWWQELAERLRKRGLSVAMYAGRMDRAILQLSGARLAAGASTGGLHLASLCGCPHYVWGAGAEERWTAIRMTNRQRYETVWNPLGTPCIYDEVGWRPSLEHATAGILRAIQKIGASRYGEARRSMGARWRVRRGLARVLEPGAGRNVVPWRVREFVRNHLV